MHQFRFHLRLVDYRGLNAVTVKNRYSLSLVNYLIDSTEQRFSAKWFERRLLPHSRPRLPIYDKEMMAVVMNFHHWHHCLDGATNIAVYIDHQALKRFYVSDPFEWMPDSLAYHTFTLWFSYFFYRKGVLKPADDPSDRAIWRGRKRLTTLPWHDYFLRFESELLRSRYTWWLWGHYGYGEFEGFGEQKRPIWVRCSFNIFTNDLVELSRKHQELDPYCMRIARQSTHVGSQISL